MAVIFRISFMTMDSWIEPDFHNCALYEFRFVGHYTSKSSYYIPYCSAYLQLKVTSTGQAVSYMTIVFFILVCFRKK